MEKSESTVVQNVGMIDRLVRLGVAVVLLFALVKGGKIPLVSALFLLGSGMLISSASSGTCPLYTHLGISTAENG
jgi:hypothetical protein